MSAVGNRRLAKLATYLEETKFASGKFHLGTWMGGYSRMCSQVNRDDPLREVLIERVNALDPTQRFEPIFAIDSNDDVMPVDCKTTGCAVGWGIAGIPAFRRAGLRFSHDMFSNQDSAAGITYYDKRTRASYGDMSAARKFFGLKDDYDCDVAEYLFVQEFYKLGQRSNPKAVAKRIRLYLDKGEKALAAAAKRAAPEQFDRE